MTPPLRNKSMTISSSDFICASHYSRIPRLKGTIFDLFLCGLCGINQVASSSLSAPLLLNPHMALPLLIHAFFGVLDD